MMTSRQAKVEAGNSRPATMAKRAVRVLGITATALGLAAAFACSSSKSGSSTSTPCNENPWECPSGQVCWPTSNSAFGCLTSGTGQVGATCMLTIGAATCSDGLNCLATTSSGEGVCSPYCEPNSTTHTCAATEACASGMLPGAGTGADFNVCVPLVEEGGTTGNEGGASEPDASDASVSVSDASASDASASDANASDVHASDAGASDASADVVVGE